MQNVEAEHQEKRRADRALAIFFIRAEVLLPLPPPRTHHKPQEPPEKEENFKRQPEPAGDHFRQWIRRRHGLTLSFYRP